MHFDGLKKLQGQWVNLWPRPIVMPGEWHARMQWRVARIDRKDGVVELQAPSGHFFNAADVVEFVDPLDNVFATDDVRAALDPSVTPLFA